MVNVSLCAQGQSEGGEGPRAGAESGPLCLPSTWRGVFASPRGHWKLFPRAQAPALLSVLVLWLLQAMGV